MGKQLTDPSVKSAKAKKDRYELSDGGNGLYLVVQPSGAKSWVLRYRMGGRPRKHTIGGYPAFGLSEARKLATAARVSAQEGKDPGEQKKAARQPSKTTSRSRLHNRIARMAPPGSVTYR